jgi:NAD(P)-dependent dehydrogenase (short-subunit alcohol dehydrogenase family)
MDPSARVAIVTGAASGTGRHWAGVLAARPDEYRVVGADIDGVALRAAHRAGAHTALPALDIRSPERWAAVAGWWGSPPRAAAARGALLPHRYHGAYAAHRLLAFPAERPPLRERSLP